MFKSTIPFVLSSLLLASSLSLGSTITSRSTEEQSQDSIEIISEQYNLGRLVGGGIVHSYSEWAKSGKYYSYRSNPFYPRSYDYANAYRGENYDHSMKMFQQYNSAYYGKEDTFQIGASLFHLGKTEYSTKMVWLPNLTFDIKPTNGHRIAVDISQENLYTEKALDGYSFSQAQINSLLDAQRTANINIAGGWRFLSNNGVISVAESNKALAYLHGPLLNQNQYRQTIFILSKFAEDKNHILNANFYPTYGVRDNFEIGLGSYIHGKKNEDLIFSVTPYAEFRKDLFKLRGNYSFYHSESYSIGNTWIRHHALINAGLLRNRDHLLQYSVESNWDHFYSTLLADGATFSFMEIQFINENLTYKGAVKENIFDNLKLTLSHRVGVNDHMILGGVVNLDFFNLSSAMNIGVNGLFHNISNPNTKLMESSKKEFLFGRILAPKKFVVTLAAILPFFNKDNGTTATLYDPFQPSTPEFSTSNTRETELLTDINHNGYADRAAHNYGTGTYAARGYVGITDWCMIQGEFYGYVQTNYSTPLSPSSNNKEFTSAFGLGTTIHTAKHFYTKAMVRFFPTSNYSERATSFSLNLNTVF